MAVIKTDKGYKSTKTGQYFTTQSKAIAAEKGSSSSTKSSAPTTKTSAGNETVQQTVDRAKAMLGTAYNPNTKVNEPVAQTVARATAMNAQTTAQGATPFKGSTFEQAYLKAPTAPMSADQISQLSSLTVPTTESSVVNPAGAIAVSAGMQSYMDAIQKQLEQQQARNDKMAKENQSLMEKTLGTMKNPEDVYEQAWEDTGMSAKEYFATQEAGIKEVESLNNEYATVQGAMEQQIAQSNDKMASMNFINNQTAQIRRNAEPQLNTISAKISSKAATLQALQGNFAEARSLVRDAVDAATAGNKFKYDMYNALYEQNRDNFDRVDKAYSEAYSNAMNIALKDYEMQREEKMQIGELMLKYPTAGIDMNGSLDEAFERAGLATPTGSGDSLTADQKNFMFAQENPAFADFLGKNGTQKTANFTDIMQQSIDAGATPEQAAREAATASELTGIPVDQATLSSWTSYAQRLVPTAPAVNETTISAPNGTYTSGSTEGGITLKSIWANLFGD